MAALAMPGATHCRSASWARWCLYQSRQKALLPINSGVTLSRQRHRQPSLIRRHSRLTSAGAHVKLRDTRSIKGLLSLKAQRAHSVAHSCARFVAATPKQSQCYWAPGVNARSVPSSSKITTWKAPLMPASSPTYSCRNDDAGGYSCRALADDEALHQRSRAFMKMKRRRRVASACAASPDSRSCEIVRSVMCACRSGPCSNHSW